MEFLSACVFERELQLNFRRRVTWLSTTNVGTSNLTSNFMSPDTLKIKKGASSWMVRAEQTAQEEELAEVGTIGS